MNLGSTYYTAVGHFCRKTDANGRSYPVILVNQEEHMVDMQEMAVWSVLNWRFLRLEQIELKYSQLAGDLPPARRTLETCLNRLEMRGLIARGVGGTDFEALYDLLGELYVVPLSESLPLRLATFAKLQKDADGQIVFGFGCYGGISGLWDAAEDTSETISETAYDEFICGLQQHIREDDAVIILEAGQEKLCYLVGSAEIITCNGHEYLDISDLAQTRASAMLDNPG